MLLKIKHLGTGDQKRGRLYHIQSPHGTDGIVALSVARARDYGKPDRIEIALLGTQYAREYPAAGELDDGPPRIRDLEGGYNTLAAFVATWEHSTPEQRADLCEYDNAIKNGRRRYGALHGEYTDRHIRKRGKWPVRHCEDRPRTVPAWPTGDGTWYRVDPADLKRALKGTRAAVRIGSTTIKPTILRQLCQHTRAELIELRAERDALGFRSVDRVYVDGMETIKHKTECTIRHGAGDPYAGRNGFEARIEFARAA